MVVDGYSLRERKHANTKIMLMNAFIKRLEKVRFDDISIRQICKSVEISEGTFFNYFPEKIDVVNYYMHCMFLRILAMARKDVEPGKYLALINATFCRLAEESLKYSNIVYQMISLMILQLQKPKVVAISNLERQILFPGMQGIDNVKVMSIEDFLNECLIGAVNKGELPRNIKIDDVLVSLMTILSGTLLATKFTTNRDKSYHYMRQLKLLWYGLGVKIRTDQT